MKTSEILSKALELISKEENWTKDVLWRDKDDNPLDIEWSVGLGSITTVETPAKFCAAGAVQWVYETIEDKPMEGGYAEMVLLRQVRRSVDTDDLGVYNDDCTHDDIIRLFEAAIKESLAAESQPNGISKLLGYE